MQERMGAKHMLMCVLTCQAILIQLCLIEYLKDFATEQHNLSIPLVYHGALKQYCSW